MSSMNTADPARQRRTKARSGLIVFAGVDTHKDLHVAAVIDAGENVLGTRSFSTTRAGYRAMLAWIARVRGAGPDRYRGKSLLRGRADPSPGQGRGQHPRGRQTGPI